MPKRTSNSLKRNSLLKKISFLVFPPHCVICGKETNGENICKDCLSKIDFLEYPLIEHRGKFFFYAITNYEGISGEVVRKLKFFNLKSLSYDVAEIFADFIRKNKIKADFVSYVPMTQKDRRKRGFNQSRLIAKNLSELLDIGFFEGIEKVRDTEKQVGLSRSKRIENMRNAFCAREKIPGDLIIVDDVYTTGATAHSVAKAFSKKSCFNIYFIAFSRKI